MISGCIQAVIVTGTAAKGFSEQTFYWPDNSNPDSIFLPIIQTAIHNQQPVIKPRCDIIAETGELLDMLSCPIYKGENLIGAIALEIVHRTEEIQRGTIRQIQIGTKWLESLLIMQETGSKEQLEILIDLVTAALEHDKFQIAAQHVINVLSRHFECSLASLGLLSDNNVKITAISDTRQSDPKASLTITLANTMGEALDQGSSVVFPPILGAQKIQATHFHAEFSKEHQQASICTIPLVDKEKAIGALLLARPKDNPFNTETIALCEQISLLLGPVFETRRREERSIPVQIFDGIKRYNSKLFGSGHLWWKAGTALTLTLLIFLSLASGTMKITSDAVLEGEVRRVIAAPQDGYIATAPARAGDMVRKGDVMATLDDEDLRLQQQKWSSQRSQLMKESRKALAGMDRSQIAILNAKLSQAEAELQLINQQLDRTKLIAPLTGIVVQGDLSQSLGAPVKQGDVLFEISPTDHYRVAIQVDDRDIALITQGQRGELKLSAIPEHAIPITVDHLTPVSTTLKGRNVFRVEAEMNWNSDLLRPGMTGVSKINVGKKKLIWIWTRRMLEWMDLFAWNHLP